MLGFKNVLSLDTPAYDMMQSTRRLPAIASSGEAGGHLLRKYAENVQSAGLHGVVLKEERPTN